MHSRGLAAVVVFLTMTWTALARADEPPSPPPRETQVASSDPLRLRGIDVSAFVHADWVVFRQSSQNEVTQDGEPLNEDRFLLRRARLRAERDFGLYHGAVELEANTLRGIQVRPVNAEVSVKWPAERPYPRATVPPPVTDEPWFIVTAGLFRTPFGYEVPEPENARPWLERTTMSNALFPQSFDLGFRVLGGFKFVRYALGIMNGDPIGERTFPGRDPDKSKDLVFRVGAAGDVTDRVHVEAGFSGLTGRGFHRGDPATKDQLVWRDINEDRLVGPLEIESLPGSPATPSETFRRWAVGADLRVKVRVPVLGDFGARAELVRAANLDRGLFFADPVVATRDLRELGWYVGAYQELTRWAMIAVRYDRYDPDSDAREREPFVLVPRDLSVSTWSFSATARHGPARLVAQFDHRKNALGRDASGAPTTLADDSFTLRAEIRF